MEIDWRYVFVAIHSVILGMMVAWAVSGLALFIGFTGESGWKRYARAVGAVMLCLYPVIAGVCIGLAKWAYDLGWGLLPKGGL